jgi:hypothetical protein
MAFCTKCGGSINSSWKHCPTCGSKIEKTPSTPKKKPTKSDKPGSEIKTSPVINGIPPEIQQVLSSSKNYSKFDKPSSKFNEKKFGITVAVILLMLVLILFQLPNESNSESLPIAETNQQSEESIQAAKELQEDKVNFWSSVNDFKSAGCKPVFTKGENWDMEVTGAQGVKDIASKYAFNTTNQEVWISWGNQVDKALVLIASYEFKLSELYWDIFDIYKERERMGIYKSQWNQYYNNLNNMAKKLCYKEEPTSSQILLAEEFIPTVDKWRGDFEMWYSEAKERSRDISQEISDYVTDLTTPKCTETKTNIPGYNIIKCTNLP